MVQFGVVASRDVGLAGHGAQPLAGFWLCARHDRRRRIHKFRSPLLLPWECAGHVA